MILMPIDLNKISYLVGNEQVLKNMPMTPALPMFSDEMVDFLAALSRELLLNKKAKAYVDVISYAYWIRKASLELVKEKHTDRRYRLGRGMAFHVAPSNVPVNFAVSMTSSLLAGNATIIRLSNKEFEQVTIICNALNKLLEGTYKSLKNYICLVRYEHDEDITQALSAVCDIRIIWGGNRTIDTIRQASLPPRAIEMTFADRHSLAVIDAKEYLNSDKKEIAKGFYTDTYYSDQNACSSPRIVIWRGDKKTIERARENFWIELEQLVVQEYDMQPIQAIDKFSSFCDLAMDKQGVKLLSHNNLVVRIEVNELTGDLLEYKNGGGYFFEYVAEDLKEIVPLLTKQCQTVSVLGVEKKEILDMIFEYGVRGVDRIVTLGQTMGLEFIWDGYKMIENMTRFVYAGEYE